MSTFKKLSKSKLAKGAMVAAAAWFLGSLFSGSSDAASTSGSWDGSFGDTGGLDPESAGVAAPDTGFGLNAALISEPPGTPGIQPLPPPVQAAASATSPTSSAAKDAFAGARASGEVTNQGWFKSLGKEAQGIIAGGMFGGAGMTIQALAQKNAMEDQKAREDRAREDKIRRGQIQAFPRSAFTNRGILSSAMGR